MRLFHPQNRTQSERHARLFAAYEIAFTLVDFSAAILFIIGSILFFNEATVVAGTWMFLIGSVFFACKPTIRLAREIHYWRMGSLDKFGSHAGE
ncbi:MAG: YrhK family protein [Pseudomonadota bacterium]